MKDWNEMPLSLEMLDHGCITLFYKETIFQEYVDRLADEVEGIFRLDAASWKTEDDFHCSISQELQFPSYYGKNLNALNDCLSDLSGKKIAVAISNFDKFKKNHDNVADTILKILQTNCWRSLLLDGFIIVLLQSTTGDITFNGWEELSPTWNRKEWLNKDHGL